MTSRPVRVEVWSDVQCIWCYIASARLRQAVTTYGGEVELVARSFELTPGAPVDIDREHQIRSHGMPEERMQEIQAMLSRLTAEEGLPYLPDRIQPTNSHLALELLHVADRTGQRSDLADRLFTAYFAEGRHLGRVDELVTLAAEVGLDVAQARRALTDRRFAAAVDGDAARARELGARGAPFHVIADTWTVAGAQPVETFLDALRRAGS